MQHTIFPLRSVATHVLWQKNLVVLLAISGLLSATATAQIRKSAPPKNASEQVLQDPNYTITQQKVLVKPAYTGFEVTLAQYATVGLF